MYRGGIHGNYDITVIYEEIVKISNVYMYKVQKSHPRYGDKWGKVQQ
jgi:hypothetical protein